MFELILLKLSKVENSISTIKRNQNAVSRKLQRLDAKVFQNRDELTNVGEAATALVKATIKCEQDVISIRDKLETVEHKQMRGSLMIKGVAEKSDENPFEVVDSFFKEKMEIEVDIDLQSAHRIGPGENRMLYTKLVDPAETGFVMSHAKNLAGKTNEHDVFFSIKEQNTELKNSQLQRARDIKMENSRLPMVHKANVMTKGENVVINNTKYTKQITTPSIKDVLLLTEEQKQELAKLKTAVGPQMEEDNNQFYSYAAKVTSFEEVQAMYFRLKKMHLAATHVLCAYGIFGVQSFNLQAFCEDNEHSCGRAMLNELKVAGVFNFVVFCIRYHSQVKLGPRRFEIYRNLVKDSIANFPGNLEYGNNVPDKQLLASLTRCIHKPKADRYRRQKRNATGGLTSLHGS